MNILKSKYHNSKWDNMNVVVLPINKLWPSVPKAEKYRNHDFYGPVMEDIKKNGLNFPLLIVDATREQIVAQKKIHKNNICDLPFSLNDDLTIRQYVIWGGSNRVRIAEELGYTHIDCVVFPNGDFAKSLQKQRLHRQPYQRQFYG